MMPRADYEARCMPQRRRLRNRPFLEMPRRRRRSRSCRARVRARADHDPLDGIDRVVERLIEPHADLRLVAWDTFIVRRDAWISGDSSAGVTVLSGSANATIRLTSLTSCRTFPGHA